MSNATEHAYTFVREQILSGRYPAGSHLKEERIAEEADVSRTPVREALRRLSTEHLVKFVPNQGAFVIAWDDDDVDGIFEIRILLEGYSAYRAATRIDEDGIKEMETCANEIETLCQEHNNENHRKTIEFNHRLHSIIVEAAGSEHLRRMISSLVEIPMLLKTIDRYSNADVERSNHHHRELIEAFRARDAGWAKNIMESHIRAGRRIYVSKDNSNTE